MGTKEEADQIGSRNPNQIHPSFQRVADRIEETPSSDEHQRRQDLLLEIPSRALEGFVTINMPPSSLTLKDVPGKEEEEVVCRICLVEVGEDSQTLRMECSCKGGLALAHQQCALKWFTLKGNKICDVCKQEVHNLSFTQTETEAQQPKPIRISPYTAWGGREAEPGVDRWNRNNKQVFKLGLVTSLAYFCVIETLTVRHFGFVSTLYTLPYSALLGGMSSYFSTTLVWSKYVWVYAAAQFGLVLLSAHFIPTDHPEERPFPRSALNVINLGWASVVFSLFCSIIDDCIVGTRRDIAERRARSNQQHGSDEVNRLHQRTLQISAQL